MAVKVVVELKTKPGKRDELKRLFETLMAEIGPSLKEKGSLGSALYAVLDDPDLLVEIADWESARHTRPSCATPRPLKRWHLDSNCWLRHLRP